MASIINSTTTAGVTVTGDNSGSLQLATNNGTTALTIDTSQNVGIGTSSPAQKLDVASKVQINTSNSYGRINIARATDSALALYIQGADNAGTSNELSLVNGGGGGAAINITGGDIRFYTGGTTTERLRLNDTGALVLQGGTVTANGTGITFPATQSASSNANTLDDYEEGTFTPTVIGLNTAGTTTYITQIGLYTKIGRAVTVSFKVGYSAATGIGTLAVRGFPFAGAGTSAEYIGSIMADNLDMPNSGSYTAYLNGGAGSSGVEIYSTTDNSGVTAVSISNESATIWGTITYFTS